MSSPINTPLQYCSRLCRKKGFTCRISLIKLLLETGTSNDIYPIWNSMEGLHKGPRIEVLPEPTQKPGKIY
jgi:hypothetical protein